MVQFNSLSLGLSSAPRLFTKIVREPVRYLRSRGHRTVVFLDDMLLVSESYEKAQKQAQEVSSLFRSLGFIINRKKSILKPTQKFDYLGFAVDTCKMALAMPSRKHRALYHECKAIDSIYSSDTETGGQVCGQVDCCITSHHTSPIASLLPSELDNPVDQQSSTLVGSSTFSFQGPTAGSALVVPGCQQMERLRDVTTPSRSPSHYGCFEKIYDGFLSQDGKILVHVNGRFLPHLIRRSINQKEMLATSFLVL